MARLVRERASFTMLRLPTYHVSRPRLIELCAQHPVVVVEASAGYGKTVLAAELRDATNAVGVEVALEPGGVSAALFTARLRSAVLRAGYTDAAAAAAEAGEDPIGAVDAILHGLADESCLFVVDDVHEALPDTGALLDRIAAGLQGAERLLILGRRLPDGAERLRRAEYLHLSSADLALTPDEALSVCQVGFHLQVDATTVAAVDRAVGGWTAATVLAAARSARTGEPLTTVAEAVVDPNHPTRVVATLLEQAMVALTPEDRDALGQVARLPILDRDVVEAATERDGLFERAIGAGVPFTPLASGAWDLPGPVRDLLVARAPSDTATLRRAADEYRRRGEHGEAIRLLLAADAPGQAADVLTRVPPDVAEAMSVLELRGFVEQLPADDVARHPRVLVLLGRAVRVLGNWQEARALLERALPLARDAGDAALEREVDAHLAALLVAELEKEEAERVARQVLAAAAPDEALTKAWAFNALGQARCNAVDSSGRRDVDALREAESCFSRATQLFLQVGLRSMAAAVTPYWAISLDLANGHARDALRRLDDALPLAVDRPRSWGYVMVFKVAAAAELGDDELCRASADEAFRVAAQLDSDILLSGGHWRLAYLTSYRGLAEETLEHFRTAERHKGGWWAPGSGDFLAEAADCLDRVGLTAQAWEYLERVKADPKDAGYKIAMAEAALESRHGDPLVAEARVHEAAATRIDQRDIWRLTLFLAHAALRRGDEVAAGALAARAFEEAAALGQDGLPLLREQELTEALLGLAVETGQPASLALQSHVAPQSLSVLGRFQLTQGGRPVPLRAAQEAQLLKLVAVRGGRVLADQVLETFWPDVDPTAGRHRLRTVLNRLRSAAGDVLTREGDALVLDAALRVDFAELLGEATRVRSLAAVNPALAASVARGAIARYHGSLLPDDLYEPWAEDPRDRARSAVLDLLRLCCEEAIARGDLDGLRRLVERAIELAPYDDTVCVAAATALMEEGRRAEAQSIVRRARAAFEGFGLDPPPALLELERQRSAAATTS
jgi:DNA-binding SARP family transcriptional activator